MKRWARSRVQAALLCSLAAGCAERAPTPDLSGYNHQFANSRFDIGEIISEMDQFQMHKVVGSVGTFSTQLASQAVLAVPNVPFPDPAFGVFPGDSEDQNAAVRSYFVGAGLPEDQIASVAADEAGLVRGEFVLRGWWSILNRGWDGVPIDDSIANAAFDASGRASGEQVYWPEIPGYVLDDVRTFQTMLADSTRKAEYIAKLPATSRDAILVIRHTSFFWKGPFRAIVCCRGQAVVGFCFDMAGHPVHLPDEELPP